MNAFERLRSEPLLHGPTQQHYLSRFYLQGFAKNGRVAVFNRDTNSIVSLTPKKAAVSEHIYTFIDEEARQRFELESLFGLIESRAGSILKDIIARKPVSREAREYFALFVAMHAIRTPAALREARLVRERAEHWRLKLSVSDAKTAYKMVKEANPSGHTEAELQSLARKMLDMIRDERFRVNVPDEMARAMSLKKWSMLAETLFERDWIIVHAPAGGEYITSDSPVVLSPLEGTEDRPVGYGSLHTHVLFPLSRTTGLIMNGDGGRIMHTEAKLEQVKRFNLAIAADCFGHLIGSDVALVRQIAVSLDLAETIWAPRIEVGIGVSPGSARPAIWIKGLGRRPRPPKAGSQQS